MKKRPILFSGPMVRAVLADVKTQTRRLTFRSEVGDRLWIKETWAADRRFDSVKPSAIPAGELLHYFADPGPKPEWAGKTRVSIFMPEWGSRCSIEITAIRKERLQEISDEDARAEGFGHAFGPGMFSRAFNSYWDTLNGERAPWSSNPEVTVVTFRRLCICESNLCDPGPTHLPSCRFADPNYDDTFSITKGRRHA